jgi:hypothetical protein
MSLHSTYMCAKGENKKICTWLTLKQRNLAKSFFSQLTAVPIRVITITLKGEGRGSRISVGRLYTWGREMR